jgi:cytochrome P450
MTETVSTGLPVGRSNPFDPSDELGRLRAQRPLCPMRFPDGHVGWLASSHSLARELLADQRFSNRGELQHSPVAVGGEVMPPREVPRGLFLATDPPDHTRYRRLLTGQFTVRRMNQLTSRIERIVADHLAAMREHGSPADLVPVFARPIPSLVICEMLGVPYAERDTFQRNTAVAMNLEHTVEQMNAAVAEIQTYLRDLVRRKRSQHDDDLLSGLIASSGLDEEELTNVTFLLLVAGHETTANMLGLGTFALLQNPRQLAALRSDPALMDNAVEELLRYLTIVQFGTTRTALQDVEVDGHVIKAGDTVSISLPAANRDPEKFEHPDALDVSRAAAGHVAFGHGIHQCLGQQLARIEMRIGYTGLFREFPDLRLAVSAQDVPLRDQMSIYGVHSLPVEWS